MKRKLWCCVGFQFKKPYYQWHSLAYTKSASIKLHTGGGDWTWIKWKSKGWKCIKVEVIINPINEVK